MPPIREPLAFALDRHEREALVTLGDELEAQGTPGFEREDEPASQHCLQRQCADRERRAMRLSPTPEQEPEHVEAGDHQELGGGGLEPVQDESERMAMTEERDRDGALTRHAVRSEMLGRAGEALGMWREMHG